MKKPSRKHVKNAAIAVGVVGSAIALNKGWKAGIEAYYTPRIGLAMHQHLLAEIDKLDPDLVKQAAETCQQQLADAVNAL